MKELNDYLGEMIETAKLSMPGNSKNPMSAPPSYQESTACLGLRQSAATLAKKLEDARSNTVAILSMLQTTPTCADPRHSGDSTHSLHLLIRCLPPRQGEPRIAALLRYFTNVDCLHSRQVSVLDPVLILTCDPMRPKADRLLSTTAPWRLLRLCESSACQTLQALKSPWCVSKAGHDPHPLPIHKWAPKNGLPRPWRPP